VRSVSEGSGWQLDDEMLDTFTQIFFGAMSSAGEVVSTAADPEAASARVEAAIGVILAGLRTLVRDGVEFSVAAATNDEPAAADAVTATVTATGTATGTATAS